MTTIQTYLAELPAETKEKFVPLFGDTEKFYATVYMVTCNEHITDIEKPDRYEDRLYMIRTAKNNIEKLLTSWGLNGKDIVADIASDYFEDYVAYKEPEFPITTDQFVGIIREILQLQL